MTLADYLGDVMNVQAEVDGSRTIWKNTILPSTLLGYIDRIDIGGVSIPVVIDPSLPPDTIELVSKNGKVKITNIAVK